MPPLRTPRSKSRLRPHLVLPLLALLAPSIALAGVFLNGVNIDGVTDQKFEDCTVVLDEKGNVLITAKGYQVEAQKEGGAEAAPVAKGPVSRRYFLVSETSSPGMTQYDVDVFINAVWIKRISHEDSQTVLEISRHLKQGKNVVHLTATKNLGGTRRSASPEHYLKVVIGEGNMGGNNVMIDNAVIEYTRTAAEMKNFSEDFKIKGR